MEKIHLVYQRSFEVNGMEGLGRRNQIKAGERCRPSSFTSMLCLSLDDRDEKSDKKLRKCYHHFMLRGNAILRYRWCRDDARAPQHGPRPPAPQKAKNILHFIVLVICSSTQLNHRRLQQYNNGLSGESLGSTPSSPSQLHLTPTEQSRLQIRRRRRRLLKLHQRRPARTSPQARARNHRP